MIEICMCSYSRPERLPIIKKQLEAQTRQDFNFNVWDNTKDNQGSQARFRLVPKTKGNPIIFLDDDESVEPDFVDYHYQEWKKQPNAMMGWFTRIFNKESYGDSIPYSPYGTNVDYVGTGGMVIDRRIFDEEPILQNIPEEFCKVEDLFLSYLARQKGMRLMALAPKCKIEVDGKDQFKQLGDYKETAFRLLRERGWRLIREGA